MRAPDAPGHAPDSDRYVEDFLYDNDADPHQKNNLVASPEHAGIRTELKQRLLNCMAQANERGTLILPAGQ